MTNQFGIVLLRPNRGRNSTKKGKELLSQVFKALATEDKQIQTAPASPVANFIPAMRIDKERCEMDVAICFYAD
jgi:hypothetical protein